MKWKTHVNKVFKGKEGFPLVEIHWHDAVAVAIEWDDDPPVTAMPTVSVGYLIDSNVDTITIVQIVNHSHVAHGITIPVGCIAKVVPLVRSSRSWPEA